MCTPLHRHTQSAGGDCCGMLLGCCPRGRNAKNLFNLIHLREVIAGLDSGIFVFKMYCYFKNWLNTLSWRKLYCLSNLHLWASTCQPVCAQIRQPHTSFFEQQQMTMGNWTGRTCRLFAWLKDIHESLIQQDKLGETAIVEIFFFPATETDVELNSDHLCVWNQSESSIQKVIQLLWSSVRAGGQSETSYLKNCQCLIS